MYVLHVHVYEYMDKCICMHVRTYVSVLYVLHVHAYDHMDCRSYRVVLTSHQ